MQIKDRGPSAGNHNIIQWGVTNMKASDVMVRDVITVRADDTVQDVAKVLLKHRISGAPVVGERGEIIGIVSEGDLMRRAETGTQYRHTWWGKCLIATETLAAEYVKANARKIADVMTTRVIAATPDTQLGDIAVMLEKNRIKRVPIVSGDKLVGIVSRANLLQALVSISSKTEGGRPADDAAIR
ncbi:MAG: CBS domain-containing protein, partial [Xanthobacteraceae bacterium]|nr:CBS domain-containing protein [Xanthobacteraceae bacterium]